VNGWNKRLILCIVYRPNHRSDAKTHTVLPTHYKRNATRNFTIGRHRSNPIESIHRFVHFFPPRPPRLPVVFFAWLPFPLAGDGAAAAAGGMNCTMIWYPLGIGHPAVSIPERAALICFWLGCNPVTIPGGSLALALAPAFVLLFFLDRSDELGGNRPWVFFCSAFFLLSAVFRAWR